MITDELPLISCILAGSTPEEIARQIRYFVLQRYPAKELVVVWNGQHRPQMRYLLQHTGLENLVSLEVPDRLNLPAMLNTAVELSKGSIVCQWNEGDYVVEHRLVSQFKHLRDNPLAVGTVPDTCLVWRPPNVKWQTLPVQQHSMFSRDCFRRSHNLLYDETDSEHLLDRLQGFGEVVFSKELLALTSAKTDGAGLPAKTIAEKKEFIVQFLGRVGFDHVVQICGDNGESIFEYQPT